MSENLILALQLMGIGMGGIFFVLFILYVVSIVLLKLFPAKKEKE